MFKPLSLFLAWRTVRAKRRTHFISFIAGASMFGIALGVMVLITVLSVINGFNQQIRARFFALVPEVTVTTKENIVGRWQALAQKINRIKGVAASAPFVSGQGVFMRRGSFNGVNVVGIAPKAESKISALSRRLIQGNLNTLKPGAFHIVMGQSLAMRLGVGMGGKINLLTPQFSVTLAGLFPRYRQFTVTGIFHTSAGFGLENSVVFINLNDAQKLFLAKNRLNGLHIKLTNLDLTNRISNHLLSILPVQYFISNWTAQFGAFFQALKMEKTLLFVMLLLIVAVAVFNLISSLVMSVNDKRSEIAILRTMGASRGLIMRTFILQGTIVSGIGIILGVLLGLLLASNVTALTNWIEHLFNVQFINAKVYFINYLPSEIKFLDVIKVAAVAFLLSLLATIYPAWLAFKTPVAEALRYE